MAINAKIIADSSSSVSLVDKAYLPSACLIRRRQQSHCTAHGHGMSIVGMVRLMVQLESSNVQLNTHSW